MKGSIAVSLALLVLLPHLAAAQDAAAPPPLMRGDLSGAAGWLLVHTPEQEPYDDWHGQGYFNLGLGWYWTNHLKTDIEAGASAETTTYATVPLVVDGYPLFATVRTTFSTRRLALGGRYQFGRNAWFHPSLGAGVELLAVRASSMDEPVWAPDPIARGRRPAARRESRDTTAHAFVSAGFKTYLSTKAFVLVDARYAFRTGPRDVLLRFGVGADF